MKDPRVRPPYRDPHAEHLLAQPPRRALFLDRDGVINVDRGYVHAAEQTEWMPGVFAFCRQAVRLGFAPVIITNQAGIARGLYSEDQFLTYTRWLHARLRERGVPVLATYYCPHHPEHGLGEFRCRCDCRKPAPGMLISAIRDLGIDPARSVLVGDKESDLVAGRAAGVGTCHLFAGRWPRLPAVSEDVR